MEAPVSDETHSPEGPATFREVFAQSEFRALYTANTLSWIGDYIAKAAVTMLVYEETQSVALSAAAFAVSYLPWLVGGPLLATVAERLPYRTVMVVCDLIRMALIALVAVPGLPVELILVLLFATTLANPPSQAARSALMPIILTGDRLVVGLSLVSSTGQAAQVGGYVAGAAIATASPQLALLLDALTFALSAALVQFGVRRRPPAMTANRRSHLLRETGEGFRMVFGTPVLRAIAVLVFAAMLFAIVPEGLAAAWATERTGDGPERSLAQALIMTASPIGFILGSLLVGRLVRPDRRRALIRPFAVVAPLALVPALLDPAPSLVAILAAVCGFAVAGLLPVANGLFVQALPHGFRARAFGVMATGMQVMQGAAVLLTGMLAEHFPIPVVVGVWSLVGVLLMLAASAHWPSPDRFTTAIDEVGRQSRPADEPEPVLSTGSVRTVDEQPVVEPAPVAFARPAATAALHQQAVSQAAPTMAATQPVSQLPGRMER
jgi:MFS family permease